MAYLNKDDHREAWIAWGIEFVRRGLWPSPEIEVHGPHYPADYMWGQSDVETHDGDYVRISFRTASGIKGIWDVKGVTIQNLEESIETFPLMKPSAKAKRWLRVADRVRKQWKDEAYQERMRAKAMRERQH